MEVAGRFTELDGWTFEPWERILLAEAEKTAAVIEGLESVESPPLSVVRELRMQRLALRQLLGSIRWPDDGDASASDWGRAMARRRWSKHG